MQSQPVCKGTLPASGSIRQSPEQFYTRTGVKFRSKSQWSYVVSKVFTVKFHTRNWWKVSQQKPVVVCSQSGNYRPQKFHTELAQSFAAKANGLKYSVRQSPYKFHSRTSAKCCRKSQWSYTVSPESGLLTSWSKSKRSLGAFHRLVKQHIWLPRLRESV